MSSKYPKKCSYPNEVWTVTDVFQFNATEYRQKPLFQAYVGEA